MSGIFFAGPPATILAAWSEGEFELLVTVDIPAEYRRVGDRLGKKYPSVDLDPVLDLVIRESRIVEPVSIPADAYSDKDDLKFPRVRVVRQRCLCRVRRWRPTPFIRIRGDRGHDAQAVPDAVPR